jgi:hypothetical protein
VAFGVFYPKSMKAYLSYSLGALSIFGFIACCFIWFNTTFPCILMIESLESLISFSNTHCNLRKRIQKSVICFLNLTKVPFDWPLFYFLM